MPQASQSDTDLPTDYPLAGFQRFLAFHVPPTTTLQTVKVVGIAVTTLVATALSLCIVGLNHGRRIRCANRCSLPPCFMQTSMLTWPDMGSCPRRCHTNMLYSKTHRRQHPVADVHCRAKVKCCIHFISPASLPQPSPTLLTRLAVHTLSGTSHLEPETTLHSFRPDRPHCISSSLVLGFTLEEANN